MVEVEEEKVKKEKEEKRHHLLSMNFLLSVIIDNIFINRFLIIGKLLIILL